MANITKNPNSLKNLKPFTSTRQPKNKGRKKKIYTILKEKGYNGQDIKLAFGELAWYTIDELKLVFKDDSKPIIARIVANQYFLALTKGDWSRIKEIMEYTIGKPDQSINLTNAEKEIIEVTYEDMNGDD